MEQILNGVLSGDTVKATRRTIPITASKYHETSTHQISGIFTFFCTFSKDTTDFGFGVHQMFCPPLSTVRREYHYMRDDTTGLMLLVHDVPNQDTVQIYHFKVISPTKQLRTSVCFKRSLFRSKIYHHFCLEHIRESVKETHSYVEFRNCPQCAMGDGLCTCDLKGPLLKHPFNNDRFVMNIYVKGEGFHTENMHKLRQDEGRNYLENPHIDVSLDLAMDIEPTKQVRKSTEGSCTEGEKRIQLVSDGDGVGEAWEGGLWGDNVNLTGEGETKTDNLHEACDQDSDVDVLNYFNICNNVSRQNSSGDSEKVEGKETNEERGEENVLNLKVEKEESEGKYETNQSLKAELRRERNRASAQRSNQRKKAFNDALKDAMRNERERADELRSREMGLRQENMRLRRLLAEK